MLTSGAQKHGKAAARRGSRSPRLVPAPAGGRRKRVAPASAGTIYERILSAIGAHLLPPGTKLAEEKLARVFNVSRTKVRQALERLAHDSVVTIIRNRGAFVSRPTIEEARQVFDARRVIEPALIRRLAERAEPGQIDRLRRHLAQEAAARARKDRRALIRLSGGFHQLIADMAGNIYLAKCLRDLESLTSLIITLYDSPSMASCPDHEHGALVAAIASGDADGAARLMIEHLDHVESPLNLHVAAGAEIDFEAVFAFPSSAR